MRKAATVNSSAAARSWVAMSAAPEIGSLVEGQALLAEGVDAGAQREGRDQQGDADGQPQRVGEEPAATAVGLAAPAIPARSGSR